MTEESSDAMGKEHGRTGVSQALLKGLDRVQCGLELSIRRYLARVYSSELVSEGGYLRLL